MKKASRVLSAAAKKRIWLRRLASEARSRLRLVMKKQTSERAKRRRQSQKRTAKLGPWRSRSAGMEGR